ncbi:Dehydrogenase RED2 [Exophiala dermatitidis]
MSVFASPREGITLEYLFRPVQGILLQPLVTAGLLLASLKKPEEAQKYLSLFTRSTVALPRFKLALKVLLAAGLVYRLNRWLSRKAVNNFVTDRTWDWRKEIVAITGGSSGIGKEMVRLLADRGIKVVILDLSPPQMPARSNIFFYKLDVTSPKEVQEVGRRIREEVGDPTVLINNAGVGPWKTILEESHEVLQQTFQVNVVSHFALIKEFLPHMIARNHGHVVTIASMASFVTISGNVSYSATKVAALALHEGLAQELKSRYGANKVRTTCVHPWWIRTPLLQPLLNAGKWKEFTLEPETVAEAVVSQVLKGESGQLIIPARLGLAAGVRGWPSWLQEVVWWSNSKVLDIPH